jgi:hypothetical protein
MKNICIIFVFLGCSSCLTLFTRSHQLVYVQSEPSGAVVKLNDRQVGVTPMQVPVKKMYEWPKITLEKEGYLPQTWYLPSTLNPWAVLNNISPWAWVIDGATAKFLRYRTKKYEVVLQEDTTSVLKR